MTKSNCTAKQGEIIQNDEGMIKDDLEKIVELTTRMRLFLCVIAKESSLRSIDVQLVIAEPMA